VPKSNRAFKSAKRSKELIRQKKREEKRLRRLAKKQPSPEGGEPDSGENSPETPSTEAE